MKLKTIILILGLLSAWVGFSIISAIMLSAIIAASTHIPYMIYIGIVLLIIGLGIIFKVSKPIFDDITRITKLIGLMKGK